MYAHRRRTLRRGFSLIELVLVIGGVSIVLVLCGGLLHTLLRLDRAGRDSMNDTTNLARLARQFRQDVHSARAAKTGDAGSLELTRPDGPPIRYKLDGGRLLREEGDGKTVARRESYAVQRLGPVTFKTDAGLVRLMLARRPLDLHAPARLAVGVEARLDKDRPTADRAEDRK